MQLPFENINTLTIYYDFAVMVYQNYNGIGTLQQNQYTGIYMYIHVQNCPHSTQTIIFPLLD